MGDRKIKDKEEEVKVLEKDSMDQVAGGKGELKVICLHCGSTNTTLVQVSKPPLFKPQLVRKCLNCGLTEDEWIQ